MAAASVGAGDGAERIKFAWVLAGPVLDGVQAKAANKTPSETASTDFTGT